jgi:hypothetical protein
VNYKNLGNSLENQFWRLPTKKYCTYSGCLFKPDKSYLSGPWLWATETRHWLKTLHWVTEIQSHGRHPLMVWNSKLQGLLDYVNNFNSWCLVLNQTSTLENLQKLKLPIHELQDIFKIKNDGHGCSNYSLPPQWWWQCSSNPSASPEDCHQQRSPKCHAAVSPYLSHSSGRSTKTFSTMQTTKSQMTLPLRAASHYQGQMTPWMCLTGLNGSQPWTWRQDIGTLPCTLATRRRQHFLPVEDCGSSQTYTLAPFQQYLNAC